MRSFLAATGVAILPGAVSAHGRHTQKKWRKRCQKRCKGNRKTCDRACDILDDDSQEFCKEGCRVALSQCKVNC